MIQRFYVHNFRCLENFELPISGRSSSLLIGKNGSGKSTVANALEVFQSIARGKNRVGDLVQPSDFARGRSDVPLRFEIEVMLDGAVFQYTLALELPAAFRELRVVEESLSRDGNGIFSRNRAQVVLAQTGVEREAKFQVNWHLVALPVIQEQSEQDPLHVFKTWLARMLILAPIPSRIGGDSEGGALMPNRECTNLAEWLTGLLAHSPAAYTQVHGFLNELMPDLKDIKNPVSGKDSRSLSVQFQQDHAAMSLSFRDLSDGEKCFFICALVLAANQAYGPIFCFWDEPDNHLSLSEVGHFVMGLRRSFEVGGQFVATSHSPEAIRQFSAENTLILYRRSHLEPTLVRPINEVQINGDLVDALIRNDVEP